MEGLEQRTSPVPPPAVWVLHSDHRLRDALVMAARQMGFIATPVDSAAQGLRWLTEARAFIPDLIIHDDAEQDMAPVDFASALAAALGELTPPVIYVVSSTEAAKALTSRLLRPEKEIVLRKPVRSRDVFRVILSVFQCCREEATVLHACGLELDIVRQTLSSNGRKIHLTRLESGFVEYVMRRRDRVVTNAELLEQVWGFEPGTGSGDVVRAHVRNLRRKLELLGVPRGLIWTVPGRGYRLRAAYDLRTLATQPSIIPWEGA
jgi:DNA-binding response OmpR family regulator